MCPHQQHPSTSPVARHFSHLPSSQDPTRDAANPLLRRASFEEVRQAQAAEEEKSKAQASGGAAGSVPAHKASWNMGGDS